MTKVTKEISVTIPPNMLATLSMNQYQEELKDISYDVLHELTFENGSKSVTSISGTLQGIAVLNVFIKILEEDITPASVLTSCCNS